MPRRALAALLLVALAATACSEPSQSENVIETSTDSAFSAVYDVLPTPTALPTTEAVVETPPPAPTPIDLRSGTGMPVAAAGAEDADGDADEGDATDDAGAYAGAVAANGESATSDDADGTDGEVATETATADAGSDADDTSGDDSGGYAAAVAADNEAATPTATPDASPDGDTGTERPTLTHDPVTGELLDTGDDDDDDDGPVDSQSPEVAIANGAEVYGVNCARCHAANGQGTFQAAGLLFMSTRYTSATMINELTSGHPVTFGFGDKLSAGEISDVVAYVLAEFG